MDRGFIGPPGFEVEGFVLREAAVVQDAEFRERGGVLQGIGLTAVVKARPEEDAARPGMLRVVLPAPFNDVFR